MSDKPRVVLSVESRFPIGELAVTAGAQNALSHHDIETALNRHISGDWGDLDKHDWNANERALKDGGRLVSVYESENGSGRFYVITEADRSYTTILLPSEY
jgi:hypothetical protein